MKQLQRLKVIWASKKRKSIMLEAEALSPAQIALYAEKYQKMRKHSVEHFIACHITTPEGNRQYDLRNDDFMRKWVYKAQKESGIVYFTGMNEITLNCLRYLVMREEVCWHTRTDRMALNSADGIKKSKEQFDALAENCKFYHANNGK